MEKIIHEFISTERVYCDFLEFARDELFAAIPLQAIKSDKETKVVKNLISNWGQLHQFHVSFLLTLEIRCLIGGAHAGGHVSTQSGTVSAVAVPNTDSGASTTATPLRLKPNAASPLANVVIKLSPYFKLYSTYTTLYPAAQKIIEETMKDSSTFEAAVKRFEALPRAKNLNLFSIIIKPLQRVCKYELFLRDLLKKAPPTNVDLQTDILMAMTKTKSIVGSVNDTSKLNENLAELADLQDCLRPVGKVNLLQSHRRLDRQGNVMAVQMLPSGVASSSSCTSSTAEATPSSTDQDSDAALSAPLSSKNCEAVTMFLVSDVLLLCRYKLKRKNMMRSVEKHRYHVAHEISLQRVAISPVDGNADGQMSERGVGTFALEITTEVGKMNASYWVISFPDQKSREEWMRAILKLVDQLEGQEKRRRSSMARSSRGSTRRMGTKSSFHSPQSMTPSPRTTHGEQKTPSSTGSDSSGRYGRNRNVSDVSSTHSTSNNNHASPFTTPSTSGTVVHCPHCNEVLNVPASAHVMKCHFCRKVFLHRHGRTVGKPVHRDGFLGVVGKSGLFGSKKTKSRYCVLTNTEISMFKSMDVFLTQGESSVKSLIPINASTICRKKEWNVFIVETPNIENGKKWTKHELNADSEDDAIKWMDAIEVAKLPRNAQRIQPQQPRFASPTLAPSHVEAYAPSLPEAPVVTAAAPVLGQTMSNVTMIPPGIDPDTFLSLPPDIQEKIRSGELGL